MNTQLEPVTATRFGKLFFLPLQNYLFAREVSRAELVAAELAPAALNFPLAFARHNNRVSLVALLSLAPDRNVFVSKQGLWLADHVPSAFRAYPFALGQPVDVRGARLRVDMASDMVSETDGKPFFGKDGRPSAELKTIVRYLYDAEKSQTLLRKVCQKINHFQLLIPWGPEDASSGDSALQGLYRVDEAKLSTLPDGMFLLLKQLGALPVIYAHMLSLGHVAKLVRLAQHHATSSARNRQLLSQCLNIKPQKSDTFSF